MIATLAALPAIALAQDKPLEWVVGFAAGGGSDIVARSIAEQMPEQMAAYAKSERERWGKVVRDNGIKLD